MSKQDIQLEIMAEGGFDTNFKNDNSPTFDWDTLESFTPENILILKEKIESQMDNPCTSCRFNEIIDPNVLDFCHYTCKDSDVQPIDLTDEVGCPDCTNVDCTCEDDLLRPLFD